MAEGGFFFDMAKKKSSGLLKKKKETLLFISLALVEMMIISWQEVKKKKFQEADGLGWLVVVHVSIHIEYTCSTFFLVGPDSMRKKGEKQKKKKK